MSCRRPVRASAAVRCLFLATLLGMATADAASSRVTASSALAKSTIAGALDVSAAGTSAAGTSAAGTSTTDTASSVAATSRYIVQLADAPLAVRPARSVPMRAAAKAARLAPPEGAYRAVLRRAQDAFIASLQAVAPGAAALYHYDVVFNGVTVRLTPEQASAASRLPGVVAVTREQPVEPLMDASLPLIRARIAWSDPRIGGQMRAGRGIRIAVIDSGITAAHPFFDDGGFTAPEGFPRSTVTVGDKVTAFPAEKVAEYTNNKVIVARTYANPENVAAGTDPTVDYDPLAKGLAGFHGAHVAGTAAGISIFGAPGTAGTGQLELSGVAPGAYVMAYKFSDAYTPEILRMIDDAVLDGADVINNSWGTALMNIYQAAHHPVSVAFKNAHDAGVVVVAAAGNSGANGEATLGGPHQMIPEVITVANSETGRGFAYYVFAKDAGLPVELTKHPAAYQTFGKAVARLERPAFKTDMCNLIEMGLGGRGKILLGPWDGACATQSPLIPFPLPAQLAFVTKIINAATIQAEAVVFHTTGDLQTTAALVELMGQLMPLIAGQLPAGVTLPPIAIIGGQGATDLVAYAETHASLQLIYDTTPEATFDAARVDVVNSTSSRGPAPDSTTARFAPLKPDLAAPGTNILSTSTDAITGAPAGFTTASGTSMASPHVTGAVAVVRQAWPEWTPDQVKAALMTTTRISGTVDVAVGAGTSGALAPATEQGSGRLDVAAAIDPQLLIDPPSFDLGTLTPADEMPPAADLDAGTDATRSAIGTRTLRLRLADVRQAAEGAAEWTLTHAPGTGPAPVPVSFPEGATIAVPEGGAADIAVVLDPTALAPGAYDGRIVLTRGQRSVHATYRLRVAPRVEDVLVVNVRRKTRPGGGGFPGIPGLPGGGGGGFDDGADNGRYWTAALDTLGVSYDVWTVAGGERPGTPPLSVLQGYRLVIVACGDGDAPLDRLPGGMTALQMYLLGGGRMLVSGTGYSHGLGTALDVQNSGAMTLLSRYFAGFDLRTDNAPLTGRLQPVHLFDKPIRLSAVASPDAAGLGAVVDLGAPLATLRTQAVGNVQPPDTGLGAVGVADRIFPYVRSFIEIDGGGSAMTGVSADASLEQPTRAPGIPWRAMFAGFSIEALATGDDTLSRAELLGDIVGWANERDDGQVVVSTTAVDGRPEAIDVSATMPPVDGTPWTIVRWRWDAGDGRPFVTTTAPGTTLAYTRPGRYTVRAEATTANGHTFVGEVVAVVTGGRTTVYLPVARRLME